MSHKKLGPIGSAVLTFIGYKQTDKQTDRQAKFIYRCYVRFTTVPIKALSDQECIIDINVYNLKTDYFQLFKK